LLSDVCITIELGGFIVFDAPRQRELPKSSMNGSLSTQMKMTKCPPRLALCSSRAARVSTPL
jgi:hypothetical protein